ncbi:YcjF family protein [Nitrosococcus wardiae]|uniref:TIGR01620 family protein n=1 Tax=Nitrosococcus wardiae TaxID=1814290 RepID=A0A4P7C2B5_9GAMM|nr:TIGR01620 family protein [Nitrosococcus wardiae]QBQ55800.1 TIGR01620 family protein [Nitrosococcus wardiae]
MSHKHWIPPVEIESEPKQVRDKEKRRSPSPRVLAEEGERAFLDYLSKSEFTEREKSLPLERDIEQLKQQTLRQRHRAFRWFLRAAVALLVSVIVLDTVTFLGAMFERSLLLGLFFTILFGMLIVAIVMWVREQVRDIWRMQDISAFQEEAKHLTEKGGHGAATNLVARIETLYSRRSDLDPGIEVFHSMVTDAHSDAEVLELFAKQVLRSLDERAYRVIVKYASQTALITIISPLVLFDAVLSLWRNVRMVREIAILYGGRPGFAGSFVLIRGVLGNLALAGVSEVVADTGAETLGGTFLASLSAQAGQGATMGIYTARVGIITMRLCRPIPFSGEDRPYLARIRKQVIKAVREAMASGSRAERQPRPGS